MPTSDDAVAALEPADASAAPDAGLRANREFQVVLAGQAVSAFGDAISITAMPLLVLFLTGSGALMGVVGALQLLPDLVLGLPAGALADRWDRRAIMRWADFGRAILTALIPLSFWLGLPTMTFILLVAVPVNVLRVLSDAAYTSSIPSLVGRDNLARANSILEATLSVPFIIGPALAGVLVATIGAPTTIAIDAATFALSAASLTLIRRSLRADRPGELPRVVDDIREGVGFVWRAVVLRTIIGYWSAMTIATAALLPALAFYLTIDRGFGAELFGFVGSVWSIGYLVGSLGVGRLGPGRLGVRMAISGGVIGLAVAAIAITSSVPVLLAAAFVIGAALAAQLISYATLRASVTPDALLGRVGSTARTLSVGLQPIGLLVGGAILDTAGGAAALLAMAGVAGAGSLLFGLSRTLREAGAAGPAG